MNNETLVAVLATIVAISLIGSAALYLTHLNRRREERRKAEMNRWADQAEINGRILKALGDVQDSNKALALSVASSLKEVSGEIVGVLSALDDSFSSRTEALVKSVDPEVSRKFSASIDHLSDILAKQGASLERFGDSGSLMASSCRKMNDNIAALRAIVFGGKRADEFSITADDPEAIRRADMESEIMTLMQDHDMSRDEATRRVRQLYSARPIG